MKFFVEVQCPGCKLQNERVHFKKAPKLFAPSHAMFKCETCESHVAVRVRLPSGNELKVDPNQVKIQVHVAVKGDTLLALEEDERNHLQSAES